MCSLWKHGKAAGADATGMLCIARMFAHHERLQEMMQHATAATRRVLEVFCFVI
jgi:hypothetical protein